MRRSIFSDASDNTHLEEHVVWEKDATNGFLSYSKMRFVKNSRQVCQKILKEQKRGEKCSDKATKFKKYPVFGTSTGSFCCRRSKS